MWRLWRIGSPEPYAPAFRVIAVLAVLVAINLFIRDGGLAMRDLNRANDPLYYAQQDSEEEQGPPSPITLTASIERGDTLAKVLAKAQVSRADAFAAVDALRKVFNPKDLKPGQEIELTPKARDMISVREAIQITPDPPAYLYRNTDEIKGSFTRAPARDEIPLPVTLEERLVVEFYS